jgi:hypothetical protein
VALIDYQKPTRTMLLYALPPAVIGTAILAAGLRGKLDAGTFILAACFYAVALIFIYAGLAYTFGLADKNNIDPNYRHPRFWERWPVGKHR